MHLPFLMQSMQAMRMGLVCGQERQAVFALFQPAGFVLLSSTERSHPPSLRGRGRDQGFDRYSGQRPGSRVGSIPPLDLAQDPMSRAARGKGGAGVQSGIGHVHAKRKSREPIEF